MIAATQSIGTGGTLEKTRKDLQKCKNTVELIRRTYSSERTSLVEYDILIPLMSMGYCHTRIGNLTGISNEKEAIEAYKEALRCLGVVLAEDARKPTRLPIADIPPHSPILCLPRVFHGHGTALMAMISEAYSAMGKDVQASRWAQAMVWADRLVLGPSLPLSKEINKAHIEKFDIERYL